MSVESSRSSNHLLVMIGGLLIAVITLLMLTASPAGAQVDGEAVYRQKCSSCHGSIGTGAPGLFPPLNGNPNVADSDYVAGVIRNGLSGEIEVLGQTYNGQMPAFANLSDDEIAAVTAFMQTGFPDASVTTTMPPLAIAPIAEGALLGREIFVGQGALEAGGPACAACHTAGQFGDLSSVEVALGGDLTGLWAATGSAEALAAAFLGSDAAAHGVYGDSPLSGEELSALASFFEEGVGEGREEFLDGLALIAAAVFLSLIATTALIAGNRREREGEAG